MHTTLPTRDNCDDPIRRFTLCQANLISRHNHCYHGPYLESFGKEEHNLLWQAGQDEPDGEEEQGKEDDAAEDE